MSHLDDHRARRIAGTDRQDHGSLTLADDEQARRIRTTDAPTPATEPAHAIARPEVYDERSRIRTFWSARPSASVPFPDGSSGRRRLFYLYGLIGLSLLVVISPLIIVAAGHPGDSVVADGAGAEVVDEGRE